MSRLQGERSRRGQVEGAQKLLDVILIKLRTQSFSPIADCTQFDPAGWSDETYGTYGTKDVLGAAKGLYAMPLDAGGEHQFFCVALARVHGREAGRPRGLPVLRLGSPD